MLNNMYTHTHTFKHTHTHTHAHADETNTHKYRTCSPTGRRELVHKLDRKRREKQAVMMLTGHFNQITGISDSSSRRLTTKQKNDNSFTKRIDPKKVYLSNIKIQIHKITIDTKRLFFFSFSFL